MQAIFQHVSVAFCFLRKVLHCFIGMGPFMLCTTWLKYRVIICIVEKALLYKRVQSVSLYMSHYLDSGNQSQEKLKPQIGVTVKWKAEIEIKHLWKKTTPKGEEAVFLNWFSFPPWDCILSIRHCGHSHLAQSRFWWNICWISEYVFEWNIW